MKNLFKTLICFAIFCFQILNTSAQVPQAFNYQAVARNVSGAVLANQAISLRFTVHSDSLSGNSVYQETQAKTTNQFGLFTAEVGKGTPVAANFSAIAWGSGNKFLQVEIDPTAGANFIDMGTSQLLSVPYALYAANAGKPDTTVFMKAFAVINSVSQDSSNNFFRNYFPVYYNDGGGLNPNTGYFYAPVDGDYLVTVNRSENLNISDKVYVYNSAVNGTLEELGVNQYSYSSCMKMHAGDYIALEVHPLQAGAWSESVMFSVYKLK